MKALLQLNTSLFPAGESTKLANEFVTAWRATHPETAVTLRDLARDPLPHLTEERLAALQSEPGARTPEQQAIVDLADTLVDELKRADVIVLGLPMYNFGVPSTLKAYFDHVARPKVTFRYGPNGAEGLLEGKKAYVFATRGGVHAGAASDSETAFVRTFLAFIGIVDVEFVFAEGLGMGAAIREAGLAQAKEAIDRLVATRPARPLAA